MVKPKTSWIYFKVIKVTKKGSILLAETAQEEREEVEVVAIGPDVKKTKVGETIIIHPRTIIKHNGVDAELMEPDVAMYGFVKEEDVIAQYIKSRKPKIDPGLS